MTDEPGLDPLSFWLEQFEREVSAYACSFMMNTVMAKALRKLIPIDFTEAQYLTKVVDPKK